MIKKIRTKPIAAEAVQYDGSQTGADEIKSWAKYVVQIADRLYIDDCGAPTRILPNDWVVKDSDGNFLQYSAETFSNTFDVIE